MKLRNKLTVLSLVVLGVMLFGMASCELFTPDALTLAGKTYTYLGANGHDNTSYAFDNTGKAGTYTTQTFTYTYPTANVAATNNADMKAWRQTGGEKGTFTYDPMTFDYTTSVTQQWQASQGAALVSGSIYDAYSWQDLLVAKNRFSSLYTAYSSTSAGKMVFTADNAERYLAFVNVSGNTWNNIITTTTSYTPVTGSATKDTSKTTISLVITDKTINYSSNSLTTSVVGSTTTNTTGKTDTNYNVTKWVMVGETWPTENFSTAWVEGKTLTFYIDQVSTTSMKYVGDTAPTAPTNFINGIADSNQANYNTNTAPYYHIDKNQLGTSMTLSHHGKYLLYSYSFFPGASRGL